MQSDFKDNYDDQKVAIEVKQEDEVMALVEAEYANSEQESICATLVRHLLIFCCSLLLIIPVFWFSHIVVVDQYKRLVHMRLGKMVRLAKGPGVFFFIPCIDSWRLVDLRITTIDVPTQEMMTKDSVTVSVNAVVYFHVQDTIKSVLACTDHVLATTLLAQTSLRAVIGECELDELLQKRDRINNRMRQILDQSTFVWGVNVTSVEIKDVVLPFNMQRAMGSQAEAERERRAKIISAEGELQLSKTLLQAAEEMAQNPSTMQLRFLQTMTQVAQEKNSTYVLPVPIELLQSFITRPNVKAD